MRTLRFPFCASLIAILLYSPVGAESVKFTHRSAQVGDQVEQTIVFRLQLEMQARQGEQIVERSQNTVLRDSRRVITTAETAGGRTIGARIRYLAASMQVDNGQQPASTHKEPVEGKVYDCRREGEQLKITNERGEIPPLAEYKIVAQNMETLGLENPLARFLTGRMVTVGEKLSLPREVAERLLGIGDELGQVTRFDLTLQEVQEKGSTRVALFQASIDAASNDSSQLRLQITGPLVLEVETCRAVRADLSGPLGMTETRGSLSNTRQMIGTGKMAIRIESTYQDAN